MNPPARSRLLPWRFFLSALAGVAMAGCTATRVAEPVLPPGTVVPVVGSGPTRFSFIAMGCMPYGAENRAAFERLLDEIDYHRPAFTVHVGDTKKGDDPPTDAFLEQVKTWFNSLRNPVIYTPGDNEWTDVHRAVPAPVSALATNRYQTVVENGRADPLVWLQKIRTTYFASERSLGQAPMELETQRRDPAHAKFVENARWSHLNVTFATVHVVGSNNNNQPAVPGAVEEFRERDAANTAWLRATFAAARSENAVGVVIFCQAEPILAHRSPGAGRESGFTQFLTTLDDEVRAFGKPVMLVHADSHRYRHEIGVQLLADRGPVPNLTRLETFGANDIHAVKVLVDPASRQVFLAGPLIVPGNPLPVLPPATNAAR